MSKVITLTKQFMKDHPRAGERTFFYAKVWKALQANFFKGYTDITSALYELNIHNKIELHELKKFIDQHQFDFGKNEGIDRWNALPAKIHTLREGKRFKTGDMISLRVWSDLPYRSPQIAIVPEFPLPRVADVEIDDMGRITIDDKTELIYRDKIELLAKNDGLSCDDFESWFSALPFSGQIIFFTDTKTPY